jgi:hypothetical protein
MKAQRLEGPKTSKPIVETSPFVSPVTFTGTIVSAVVGDLVQRLLCSPEDIYRLSAQQFEELIVDRPGAGTAPRHDDCSHRVWHPP